MPVKLRVCPICQSDSPKSLEWFIADENRINPYALSHIRDTTVLKKMELVICTQCACVYYRFIPTDISTMYKNDYRKIEDLESRLRGSGNHKKNILWHSLLNNIIKPGMRVLDIGCSEGFFVKFLRDRGVDAEGLEINDLSVSFGRDKFKVPIHHCDVLTLKADKYDLVFNSGYLEHVENPRAVLDHIRTELLTDKGFLYVQTPNVFEPNQTYLSQFFPPEHFQTFSPKTLPYLASLCGFKAIFEQYDLFNCGMAFVFRVSPEKKELPVPSFLESEHRFLDIHSNYCAMLSNKTFQPITTFLSYVLLNNAMNKKSFQLHPFHGDYSYTQIIISLLQKIHLNEAYGVYEKIGDHLKKHGYHRPTV